MIEHPIDHPDTKQWAKQSQEATLNDVVLKLDTLIDRIDALNYNLGYLIELARNRF